MYNDILNHFSDTYIYYLVYFQKNSNNQYNIVNENHFENSENKKNGFNKMLIICISVFSIIIVISIALFYYTNYKNRKYEEPSQLFGSWFQYDEMNKERSVHLELYSDGTFSCDIEEGTLQYGSTSRTKKGTFLIEGNKVTLYSNGGIWDEYEIIDCRTLRSCIYGKKLEYRKLSK